MIKIENFALKVQVFESGITDVIGVTDPNEATTVLDFRRRSFGGLEDNNIKPTPASCIRERDVALIVRVSEEL